MHEFYPSGFLFPLKGLSTISTATLESVMEKLALIYSRGDDAQLVSGRHSKFKGRVDGSLAHLDTSLRANRTEKRAKEVDPVPVVDSGYASAEENEDNEEDEDKNFKEMFEIIRADSYEREFTIRWLTGFISLSATWVLPVDISLSEEETEEREALVEKAASLLSACAIVDEEDDKTLSRQFAFPLCSSDAEKTICVQLDDLLAPEDHSSVGLQSWASSIHFAKMMSEDPERFRLLPGSSKRILELGAGTGMLSIVAAKILHLLDEDGSPSCTTIVATDYHPDVLANLQRNIAANASPDMYSSVAVRPLDWQYPSWKRPFDAPFDLILAADVVYDPSHAGWINNCVSRLLKKPTSSCPEGGVLWMIIALRNSGRHAGLADAVFTIFPTSETGLNDPKSELILKAVEVQDLERCDGVGRKDEAGYRLLKICWA